MKFVVEDNLSKVGRWLRFLGHDVVIIKGPLSRELLFSYGDRMFITTSRKWSEWATGVNINNLLVPRHDWRLQLCLVLKRLGLEASLNLRKCVFCGSDLVSINRENVKDKIPPAAYAHAYDFTLCPNCSMVFWKGTHYGGMIRTLRNVISQC